MNERIARLEVLVESLSDLVKEHMAREEKEREELIQKINALSESHIVIRTDFNNKKHFIAGVVAAVSLAWVAAFGIFEFFKYFAGK
jgi:hypothetical protein